MAKSPRSALVGALVVALAAVGVAMWRSHALEKESSPPAQRQAIFDNWSGLRTDPTDGMTTEGLASVLLGADWSRAAVSNNERDTLVRAASEFLFWRYGQEDPSAYREWRAERGYTLIPRDVFVPDRRFGFVWEAVFHAPLPAEIKMEAMFDAFWPVGTSFFGGRDVPVRVASEGAGVSIAIGPMPVSDPRQRPTMSNGPHPNSDWTGTGGATMRAWFEPPVAMGSLAGSDGTVHAAEVGVIVEYKNGERRPLGLTFVWDGGRRQWWLMYVCQYNVPLDGRVAALEF